jgi:glycosyltransferase involved in cell wall biosynthesis
MVGAIEPRRGQAQALAAFERLWREGRDLNLVIVGRQGRMVEREALANTIEEWLALHDRKNHSKSDGIPWLTWKERAATLSQ